MIRNYAVRIARSGALNRVKLFGTIANRGNFQGTLRGQSFVLGFMRFSGNRWFSASDNIQKSLLRSLSVIIDPDLGRDIVSLGFVKNMVISEDSGLVTFDLELTTPACPVKDQFVAACEQALRKDHGWVKEVRVTLTAQPKKKGGSVGGGLDRVSNIIAVSSCKGGVGKSTVAFNLASSLRQRGARVGLLDCDIFGPSLPVFIPRAVKGPLDDKMPQQVQVFLDEKSGMKLMSMGYLKPTEGVALRGPMVSGLIQQLLTSTGWGELDYLVLDMPPGTSDIHLTIGQHAPIDGAVVVTTPHQLAVVDVEKGIDLLNKMKTPTVALVENFSYFKCGSCDVKHDIFGTSGSATRVAHKYGIENVIKMPIRSPGSAEQDKESAALFESIADTVVREIAKQKFSAVKTELSVSEDNNFVITETSGDDKVAFSGKIPFRNLRLNCKSATMIDEWTGKKLFKDEDIAMDVKPTKVEKAGNYAYRIDWSDNHHSIFPIKAIRDLCAYVHKE